MLLVCTNLPQMAQSGGGGRGRRYNICKNDVFEKD
jgi:hypothetical protein